MLNLPNVLSLFRILLVPLLVVILLTKFDGKELVGLAVFLVAAATDFLDGFIARRQQKVTRLGKLLDPVADKLLTSAAFISLVELGLAPAWMVVTIIARELAVSGLRAIAAAERLVIPASAAGKVKTVTQIVAISLLIVYDRLGAFERMAQLSLWAAMILSVYSGLEYGLRCRALFVGAEGRPGPTAG